VSAPRRETSSPAESGRGFVVNKNVMVGVVGFVVVGSLAAVGGTAFWMWRKNHGASDGLSRLPPTSFVVARVEFDQLLRFSPMSELRRTVTHPGPGATRQETEFARKFQEVITRCTFDPADRVHTIFVGADRTLLTGRSSNAWVASANHDATPDQATRCLTAVVEFGHGTVASTAVNGHAVLTPRTQNQTPSASDPSVHFMPGSAIASPQSYMPTALGFAYRQTPGLDANAPLPQMMGRLGAQRAITVAVDVAAIRTQNQQTVTEVVDDLVRENPNSADLTLARQMQTGGLALGLLNNGVELLARGEFASATVARPFTAALQSVWAARKPEIVSTISEAQQGLGAMRAMAGLAGGQSSDERFTRVEAAFGVARAAVDQLRITQDDRAAVVVLTLTPAQVTTLVNAVRAVKELASDMSRMTGGLPGMGGGSQPERPDPQAPAVRMPGLTF